MCSREWLTAPPLVLLPRQEVTELLKPVVDKNKHKKMTDHVAEQIEMKFKAATVPQPPTELVWPVSTISTALAVRNGSESSRCGRSLCTFVTHLRGCTWQPIFRVFEVLKAVIF
jgi:hypothetical protein